MSTENTQIGPGPDLAGAACSARCRWIISALGDPFRECGARATQIAPDNGDTLCDDHAEDYAEVFGWESLRDMDANESPNAEALRRRRTNDEYQD